MRTRASDVAGPAASGDHVRPTAGDDVGVGPRDHAEACSGPAVATPERVERALVLFRAMAHADRLLVLLALDDAPRCVSELTTMCGVSQSAMSHQLRALREAGLVRAERVGKQVFYALADQHVAHIIRDVMAHADEVE